MSVIDFAQHFFLLPATCTRCVFHRYRQRLFSIVFLAYVAGASSVILLFQGTTVHAQIKTVGLLLGSGGLGDQSYNDMTFSGLGKAQKEFGFSLIIAETYGSMESQKSALDRLIQRGADVIVANGAGLHKIIVECAPDNPQKYFIVNDYAIEGYPNIVSTVFAHEEGSYLVGILAASHTRSEKIGFIGGVDIPVLHSFLEGYRSGAESVSPSIQVDVSFVTQAGDYSGFNKPSEGYEIATGMYGRGADIIYAVAGLTGNGVIQAAVKMNKLAVGVDSDQDHLAKGNVLTSMMKRLDRAAYAEIKKIIQGEFIPGIAFYNLTNGGISLSPMRYTRHLISDNTLELIRKARTDIINGEIDLP